MQKLKEESRFDYKARRYEEEREIDLANDEYHLQQLENERLSWQQMFIEIAKVVAKRSMDPKTKVGAVLVKENHVIGVGYNGTPRNFQYNFNRNTEEKYNYVIHAELNAVANACYIGADVKDSDIYLTLSPCHECIKILIQHQIKNVYYLEEYKDFELTKKIADNSPINLIKLK